MLKEKKFILWQKWWFWLFVIVAIVIIIIMGIGFKIATSGASKITLDLHNKINKDIIVYTSTGSTILTVELPEYDYNNSEDVNTRSNEVEEVVNVLEGYVNTVLSTYEKLYIYLTINENGEKTLVKYELKCNHESGKIEESKVESFDYSFTF